MEKFFDCEALRGDSLPREPFFVCKLTETMDHFDFRPRFSPVIDSVPYRFSIGAYRGKKRVVIAWFSEEKPASDYLVRCRFDHPYIKFDCLESLL